MYASGSVPAGEREQAQAHLGWFLGGLGEGWSSVRVRLTGVEGEGLPWAALAQANVEYRGQPIRAQVAAPFFAEASLLLVDRLVEQFDRLANPTRPRPWPPIVPRPESVHRPAAYRRVVRTKRYGLTRCDPRRAALLMDLGDYDFYLFTDTTPRSTAGGDGNGGAGVTAVVYRVGPTGYRLAHLDGLVPPPPGTAFPISTSVYPVPRCTLARAVAQLAATDSRFLFFRHTENGTGQGAVLYRRYDGHYALLTAINSHDHAIDAQIRRWSRRGGE
ncbi:hypothetical protein BKA01_003045 [Pseudonocardia eucalypti]|uniref:sigma 54 modulation/S30EA ribosomal C-terminal domain-containing protein n=1 Tax=Pseudonocardia eucalypti TaxID=648755 RepID=UPI001616CD6E|nr:hypothetical protein [Pseudonocardia eucalypti]